MHFSYFNLGFEDDDEEAFDDVIPADGKIGTKKQRKLEEKAARKAQREVSFSPLDAGGRYTGFAQLQNGARHRYTGSAQISLRRQKPVYRVCVNL